MKTRARHITEVECENDADLHRNIGFLLLRVSSQLIKHFKYLDRPHGLPSIATALPAPSDFWSR